MKQSDVMKYILESIRGSLVDISGKERIFMVEECGQKRDSGSDQLPVVRIEITDVCQLAFDKSGERIVVDEKQYEPPTQFAMCIRFAVSGADVSLVLGAVGELAVFFKDNPSVDISDCSWHGNDLKKIFLEPVIRQPVPGNELQKDGCVLNLDYRIDFGINSRRGTTFKRVENRDLRSRMIK
jgi:hypothetical protein